jgi:hypothetical protein
MILPTEEMPMMRPMMTLLAAMMLWALAGCADETQPVIRGGTQRVIVTDADSAAAFAAAKSVLSQYFSIESADPVTGVIQSRPRQTELGGERILGSNPAQETATLALRRVDGRLVATLHIQVERLAQPAMRALAPRADTYSGVPDQTPADMEAATTPRQNATWRPAGRNHQLEASILDELHRALGRAPQTQPTQPA